MTLSKLPGPSSSLSFPICTTPPPPPLLSATAEVQECGERSQDPGWLPRRLLFPATWSIWFPRAQTAIWLTFLAAQSHPVAGDGDTAVAQTDRPATSVFQCWGTDLCWHSRAAELRNSLWNTPMGQLAQPES